MRIQSINQSSPYLQDVIELGKKNTPTLGFLPQGGYLAYATKEQILVALAPNDKVVGYLLYGSNRRTNSIYIVHLCVDNAFQNQGVAKELFKRLCELTSKEFLGVRVRCRVDYAANAVWPKLGFKEVNRKAGRSLKGSTLVVWWFDYGHPNLFSVSTDIPNKVEAVIDANIFFELQNAEKSGKPDVVALLNDWLQETVELCLTDEIFNEISRGSNPVRKHENIEFSKDFPKTSAPKAKFQETENRLRPYFPGNLTASDESDIKQLAWSIAANIPFFITTDVQLLNKNENIHLEFGIRIIHPVDFIIQQDYSLREIEYQPVRLAGSPINRVKVLSGFSSILESVFRAYQGETKSSFKKLILPMLSNPRSYNVETIYGNEDPLALIAYKRENDRILEMPLLRLAKSSLAGTLARFLILESIFIASTENRLVTLVSDPYLSEDVIGALQELGFIYSSQGWVKVNLSEILTSADLAAKLRSFSGNILDTSYVDKVTSALDLAIQTQSAPLFLDIERSLWPAKILDLEIPCFIIPIQPWFAMQLFDDKLARQDLFGAQDPNLSMRIENVYYRTSRQKALVAPARVLWYVSKGKGNYLGSMAIRASSYIDEVIIDKPKLLYSRFRRLGIYTWNNVRETARDDLDREIMAFRFSQTEMFQYPIRHAALSQMWKQKTGKNFSVQAPLKISPDAFMRIYKLGMIK